jgi:hypothetical protein
MFSTSDGPYRLSQELPLEAEKIETNMAIQVARHWLHSATQQQLLRILPLTYCCNCLSVTDDGCFLTTQAIGISPAFASGIPMTAASATSEWDNNIDSSSAGATWTKINSYNLRIHKVSLHSDMDPQSYHIL